MGLDLPAFYESLVEDGRDPIWVLDPYGDIVYGNQAVADLVGVDRAALTQMSVLDFLDEDGRTQGRYFLDLVRQGATTPAESESLIYDRSGRPHWVLMRQHLLLEDGQVRWIVHRLSDHEQRRAAHDALSLSQQRLREVQAIAMIEEWQWRTRGLPAEIDQVVAQVHPRDRARGARALRTAIAHAAEHGATGDLQMDVREAGSGPTRWWRMRAVAQHLDDGTVEFIGSRQDISEVKETELALRRESDLNELLRGVASAANEADSVVGTLQGIDRLDRPFDRWEQVHVLAPGSDGALEVLVATRGSLPLARTALGLAEAAAARCRARWATDGLTIAYPVVHDGLCRLVLVLQRSSPPDGRASVEQMLGDVALQLEHVVEREEARTQLGQARDAAMEASRQKSEFLATMSHEIRTPLNGILGLNELLLDSPLGPEQRRLVTGAQSAGRTLLRLINEVLDFSRIQATGLQLEQLPFDVAALLEHVVRLGEPSRSADVTLTGTTHADLPPVLVGDPTKLSQVLGNLLANALKFTDSGTVEVSLSMVTPEPGATGVGAVTGVDDGVRRLRCEVADTGIGIDPDKVEALFEPFVQGDAATTRRFGGTGLGLAIARDIVAALGGTLTHRPRPGGGSVFSFDAVCTAADDSVTATDTRAGEALAGRRVLLVCDDVARRATWAAAVTRWRMEGLAADADRAVATLQDATEGRTPLDVVLIDVDATREGLALAQEVAALQELDDVVMVLLGDGSVPDDHLLDAGVSAHLERPVSVGDVRTAFLEQVAGVAVATRGRTTPAPERRVLVVEDNEANQLVATTLLSSMGFAHDVAADGAQALDLMDRTAYDAVLMDIQMPVLDGYDTTRALRERERAAHGPRLPVVAITASAVRGERERCLAAGMDDFLTKPVDLPELTRTLHRWVGFADSPPTTGEVVLAQAAPADEPTDTSPAVTTQEPALLDAGRLDMLGDLDLEGEAYLDRAIANFTRNSAEAVARIRALVDAGDPAAAAPVAHKIAGSALNLGCLRAGELARSFELVCEAAAPQRSHGLDSHVAELDEAMGQARCLLADYQRENAGA